MLKRITTERRSDCDNKYKMRVAATRYEQDDYLQFTNGQVKRLLNVVEGNRTIRSSESRLRPISTVTDLQTKSQFAHKDKDKFKIIVELLSKIQRENRTQFRTKWLYQKMHNRKATEKGMVGSNKTT